MATTPTGNPTSGARVQSAPVYTELLPASERQLAVCDVAESKLRETENHRNIYQQICRKKQGKVCRFKDCNRRITSADAIFRCLCKKVFCSEHRFFTNHNCQFDRKARAKAKLSHELDPTNSDDPNPKHFKSFDEKQEPNSSY